MSLQRDKYLPNVRRLFLPDPGHTLIDVDLSGADAQVVAWEANDDKLKTFFRTGAKLHIKNFEDMFERKFDETKDKRVVPAGWNYPPYDSMKRFVHATNYGASPRTVAITLGWRVAAAESYQWKWFHLHPSIRDWQKRVEFDIQSSRTIRNAFGYRIVYFDRPDGLLPQGLAWIPQSTIAILTSRGAVNLKRSIPWLSLRMQVHDSLVFQIPNHRFTPTNLATIKNILHIPIPYPDPLTIPWSIAASTKSWADCSSISWLGETK